MDDNKIGKNINEKSMQDILHTFKNCVWQMRLFLLLRIFQFIFHEIVTPQDTLTISHYLLQQLNA